jgi:hypothetical protein
MRMPESEMSAEQEERLFSILRHGVAPASQPELPPWEERLALVLTILQTNAADFELLYVKGGRHPKDLDRARLCNTLATVIGALFPELAG